MDLFNKIVTPSDSVDKVIAVLKERICNDPRDFERDVDMSDQFSRLNVKDSFNMRSEQELSECHNI